MTDKIKLMTDYLQNTHGDTIGPISIIAKSDKFSTLATMTDCTRRNYLLQLTHSTDYVRLPLTVVPHQTNLSYYSPCHRKHFVIDTANIDLFIQYHDHNLMITYTALQAHIMAQYFDLWEADICEGFDRSFALCIPYHDYADLLDNYQEVTSCI
jgi:hypothetical protein